MFTFSRGQVLLFCLIQICFVTQAFFIKPGYGNIARNRRGHTTVCVQIKPNIAGSHEPYYMCKGPELASRQLQESPPFEKPSAENYGNFNKQQQHFEPPQNIQFGNAYYQQSPPSAQSVQPQMPQHMPHYIPSPSAALISADQHDHNVPTVPTYYNDVTAKIPLSSPSNSHRSNYENIPQSSSNLSKTDILPAREITQSDERNPNPKQETRRTQNEDLSGLEMPSRDKIIKHPINPDDFQNMLQEEVLGMPNLGFSHDDLLPIHNMYQEDNPEFNVPSQGASIPPEYLDDPILRTFYNINQNTNNNFEEPAITSQNYGEFKGNINDCLNAQQHSMPEYQPLTEPMAPNKCCGCPYTFQPIFIAIPWFANSYHNLQTNMPPTTCGHFPTYEQSLAYDSTPTHDNPYQPQSRSDQDNTSTEDLKSKKPSTEPELKTTNIQPLTKTTKTPESSEEDLFAEDTTTKSSKATSKTEDDTSNEDKGSDEEEELKTSTTNAPFTTVRTFKTMMHAAKMAAKMAGRSNIEDIHQSQNKRQIHYVGYPNNFKRQYVRKLERMYK